MTEQEIITAQNFYIESVFYTSALLSAIYVALLIRV